MKRIALIILALVGFSQAQAQPLEKSLLWKIEGNGLEKPSYVFGTIHQICKEELLWTPVMQETFEHAEKLCLEMDMDDMGTMMKVGQGLMSTDGKTLKDRFNKKEYSQLSLFMKNKAGIDIAALNGMKPVALMSVILQANSKCKTNTSYEQELMAKAKTTSTEVVGIEQAEEQIEALNKLPEDSVKQYVVDMVNGKKDATKDIQKMLVFYKQQDIQSLYDYIQKHADSWSGSMDGLLDGRNEKWIPRIGEMSKQHSVFYAVGAGHLAGEKGVIHLLRKAGYTVTPIK